MERRKLKAAPTIFTLSLKISVFLFWILLLRSANAAEYEGNDYDYEYYGDYEPLYNGDEYVDANPALHDYHYGSEQRRQVRPKKELGWADINWLNRSLASLAEVECEPVTTSKAETNTICIPDPSAETTAEPTTGDSTNGTATNGSATNGSATNGTETNGAEKIGTETNGTEKNGTATNGSATNGSATNETATNGSATNGSATNETVTNGSATNGSATNETATNGSTTNGSETNGSSTPQPDGSQPDGSQPDGSQPDGSQPDGSQPDGSQPDGSQPDGSQPDGTQPDGSQPDGSQPDGTQPDGTQPDGSQPDGSQDTTTCEPPPTTTDCEPFQTIWTNGGSIYNQIIPNKSKLSSALSGVFRLPAVNNDQDERAKELRNMVQRLYIAQARVQLEASEIKKAQAIANEAQQQLEESANHVRAITAALQNAQQEVASSAIRAQTAQLQLAAHDQLLFAARQDVDALSSQMVGLQAAEGIAQPKASFDIGALMEKLRQPLLKHEKPTPVPMIVSKALNVKEKKHMAQSKPEYYYDEEYYDY